VTESNQFPPNQVPTGNLIEHDPMVAAIFSVIAGFDTPALQKLYAVARAGDIAKAYLGTNHNDTTTAVRESAFPLKRQP
jgi:hypothetical protein